jgi:hypothetical protein
MSLSGPNCWDVRIGKSLGSNSLPREALLDPGGATIPFWLSNSFITGVRRSSDDMEEGNYLEDVVCDGIPAVGSFILETSISAETEERAKNRMTISDSEPASLRSSSPLIASGSDCVVSSGK